MKRLRAGFTLIELLVTLAVLAALASAVVPMAQVTVQRAREQELRRALREIREALDAYKRAGDEGRIPRAAGASGYPASLAVLVEGVPDQRDPKKRTIYFLRRVPADPFAADAQGDAAQSWGKRSYASAPDSPEEGEDVFDVYSRAPGVGLNGAPYSAW